MTDIVYFDVDDLLAAQQALEREAGVVRAPYTAGELVRIVSEEIDYLYRVGWSPEEVAEAIRHFSGKPVTAEDVEDNLVSIREIYRFPGGS